MNETGTETRPGLLFDSRGDAATDNGPRAVFPAESDLVSITPPPQPERVTTWDVPMTSPFAFSALTWKYGPGLSVVTAVSKPVRPAWSTTTDRDRASGPASTCHALVSVEPFQEA